MCGIIAYTGHRQAQPILLDGLGRLEYRGYDSAGIAVLNGSLKIVKSAGRIAKLAKVCGQSPSAGKTGISHTRWATHGEATDINAHPHTDQSGKLALIHNGVIENYMEIKEKLLAEGHTFYSQTDSEVLAHLIGKYFDESKKEGGDRLLEGVQKALASVNGTYGIAVVHADVPDFVVGSRRGSPLVLGVGEKENFLSSDANALNGYTQKVIFIKDNEIVSITPSNFSVTTADLRASQFEIEKIDAQVLQTDKGEYPHYMLKEIFEQPQAIQNAYRGRLDKDEASAKLGGLDLSLAALRDIRRIMVIGCGTALHSGMVGEYIIESLAHIPVECNHASEFRYRNTPLDPNTVFFAVSQSGETADTLGGLREARRRGYRCLGICNNVASAIARESDGGVYMHAGPEIGVASTKAFTSQLVVFNLLALLLGRMEFVSASYGRQMIEALEALPAQVETILKQSDAIQKIAVKYKDVRSMLFFGRNMNYPIALEGALKMKEITYIHAEGHPSAELKHGIIALVDENTPSVFIMPRDGVYEKNMSNVQEVKARKGKTICVATEDDSKIASVADDVFFVPNTLDCLQPILNIIPLQLFAYHTAVALGRDVDKPRNLAKSVVVE